MKGIVIHKEGYEAFIRLSAITAVDTFVFGTEKYTRIHTGDTYFKVNDDFDAIMDAIFKAEESEGE